MIEPCQSVSPIVLSREEPEARDRGRENEHLLHRVKEGDSEALDLLVQENMGLVRHAAQRFRDRGVEMEDLLQLGTIGMIKAARSFDFSFGSAFSTYAVPLIAGEIRRFLRDDGPVKVSRRIKQTGLVALRARESFLSEKGREPKLSELAALTGIPPEELAVALEAASPVRSLSEPVGGDEGGACLSDFIGEEESELDRLTDRLALKEAISRLAPLQRQILHLRYDRELSQQQTGKILGLSQVKVSREEKKILQLLRSLL